MDTYFFIHFSIFRGNHLSITTQLLIKFQHPNFYRFIKILHDINNLNKPGYMKLLKDWNLFSEIKLVKENEKILSQIENDKRMTRVYNQKSFNISRYNFLTE